MNENKTAEGKDINLIAIKSLIECIDNRDIAEGGIFLDDDNAEFVADILRYHYELLTSKNKMEAVAKLFGKELGEEFRVKDLITAKIYVASFCNYGMRAYVEGFPHSEKPRWDMIMRLILGGSAVIIDE